MFRPDSAIFRLEYSIWGKLSVWSKCKWEGGDEISFTNMGIVAETVLAQGVSAWWSVAPRGWFLRHGGLVSEIVSLELQIYKYSCVFDCHCWLLIYCKFDIHKGDDTPWAVSTYKSESLSSHQPDQFLVPSVKEIGITLHWSTGNNSQLNCEQYEPNHKV